MEFPGVFGLATIPVLRESPRRQSFSPYDLEWFFPIEGWVVKVIVKTSYDKIIIHTYFDKESKVSSTGHIPMTIFQKRVPPYPT